MRLAEWGLVAAVVYLVAYELWVVVWHNRRKAPEQRLTLSQMVWTAIGVRVRCPNCGDWFTRRMVVGYVIVSALMYLMGHLFA